MEAVYPDVWFLNYTNPMAMNCLAVNRASSIRTVGLCHSVQGTAYELSLDLGIPFPEVHTAPPASTTWRSTSTSRK